MCASTVSRPAPEARPGEGLGSSLTRDRTDYDRLLECQHRIKNHLQLAAAMLERQARECPDGLARLAILSAHVRLQAVARLQGWADGGDEHAAVALDQYLGDYCNDLSAALGMTGQPSVGPRLDAHIAACRVSTDQAMTLALIVGELVTNAVKHARAEVIEVDWAPDRGGWRLAVTDDGCGLPSGVIAGSTGPRSAGQGAILLKRMAATLGGVWDIGTPDRGASIALRIGPGGLGPPRP